MENRIDLWKCVKKGRMPVLEKLSQQAIVDKEVFEELNAVHWFLTAKGYVRRKIRMNGQTINFAMHAEVMRVAGTPRPSNTHTCDHINGDKLDNRVANLRWATPVQQAVNTRWNRTLPRGVMKRGNRYVAQITSRSKNVHLHLGTFDTEEEASAVFEKAWSELHPDLLAFRR